MSILAYTSLPTCSSWMSTPCKMLPEKVFHRVPKDSMCSLSAVPSQATSLCCCPLHASWQDVLWWCPLPPPWAQQTLWLLPSRPQEQTPFHTALPVCPFALLIQGQETPVLSPLIPCGRIGENSRLSPCCHILVERPQSRVVWLSVPSCVTKSIDWSIDSSVLSKTVSSLGSTIDLRVGLAKILVLQLSKCLSPAKDWGSVYCTKHS